MAKWADYLVSAVRYTTTNNTRYISKLRVHLDNETSVGGPSEMDRNKVIQLIEAGKTFVTIYKKNSGDTNWQRGKAIEVYTLNGKKFIKTISNNKEEDNLEELPEF